MGQDLFWPGYKGAAILDSYTEKTLGRMYRRDPKKKENGSRCGHSFSTRPVRCSRKDSILVG